MTPYIDLHCDTLHGAWKRKKPDIYRLKGTHADVDRLRAGGCRAQCFAVFLPPATEQRDPEAQPLQDEQYIQQLCDIFQNTLKRHGDVIAPARTRAELEDNKRSGKLSAILTMEDGRAVNGRPENLERFYGMGVRILTLTWNHHNCFGAPNSSDPRIMAQGLTEFGRHAIPYMERLGMGIDVSHLSDGGFWDVAAMAKKPFLATHSNCRAINPHPRSMTDEMIHALADRGGVMGVNFVPEFLGRDTSSKFASAELAVQQLRHMIDVGGADCAAIGGDFDGFDGQAEIDSAHKMPLLFDFLERAGFTASEIEGIAWKNAERSLREIL